MITQLIRQARRLRTDATLVHPCSRQYAFVGMGSHSMTNLYPVLGLLHVPLKYICVTSSHKAKLISAHLDLSQVVVTTSLDDVLADPEVAAVFVSATPSAHYSIVSEALQQGKALFVEKPPCMSLFQLEKLVALQEQRGTLVQVGMQKRYAPAIRMLRSRLKNDTVLNYSLRYCVGRYPEGDALTQLFIHPIDLALHLFGPAEVIAVQCVADHTLVLMLSQGNVVGTVELSTGYSWALPVEELLVHTRLGVYALSGIDTLTFQPAGASFAGIPWEKIRHCRIAEEYICRHDSFSPTLASSIWIEHGFYHELKDFIDQVENRSSAKRPWAENADIRPTLQSLLPTYKMIDTCLHRMNVGR